MEHRHVRGVIAGEDHDVNGLGIVAGLKGASAWLT